jgi:hypothetical protein
LIEALVNVLTRINLHAYTHANTNANTNANANPTTDITTNVECSWTSSTGMDFYPPLIKHCIFTGNTIPASKICVLVFRVNLPLYVSYYRRRLDRFVKARQIIARFLGMVGFECGGD